MSERSKDHSQGERSHGHKKDTPIDHLLQQALKDDIPPDVETALKNRLNQFRLKMEQAETLRTSTGQKVFRRMVRFEDIRWARFLIHKEVLVALSLSMIVLGGFIQSSGSSNQLTENLSVLGTSVVVTNQMNRSHSMECSIQMPREGQKPLKYTIQWLSPNLSKIKVNESIETPLKTIWISQEDIIIADHVDGRVYKKRHPAQFKDPLIKPIIGFLAPLELAEQMYGEWKLKQSEQKGEYDLGMFTVFLPNEKAFLEVAVDLSTFLPVTVKKILPEEGQDDKKLIFHVQYTWNTPLSPEHLYPKSIKESQKA